MFKSPTSVVHAHQCVISIEFREEKRKEKKRKEKKRKEKKRLRLLASI